MKRSKINQAIDHIDDSLIVGATKRSSSAPVWKRVAAFAAAFVLILTGSVMIANFFAVGSGAIIALDVNPSIEIEVDRNGKLDEVEALNADAKKVLEGINFKGADLETAVNAIIESLIANGYITAEQNSILISVDTDDAERSATIKADIAAKVAALLGQSKIEASLITQDFKKDNDKEEGVSSAVSALIKKIVEAGLTNSNGVPYTADMLAGLKVNELKLILESKNITVGGIESSGTAADGNYIGKDAALAKALEKAGLTADAVREIEIELDYNKKTQTMIYEVEFALGTTEYEYEIDATTGAMLKEDIELDEHDDVDVDDDDDDDDDRKENIPENVISKADALAAALADAGLTAEAVSDVDCDYHGKIGAYYVEFETADTEYDYKIDAVSGAVIDKKTKANAPDLDDDDDDDDNAAPPAESITKETAIAKALADAGLSAEQVKDLEAEFEADGGKAIFEVEFETAENEFEYKIDALTGEILKKKVDR